MLGDIDWLPLLVTDALCSTRKSFLLREYRGTLHRPGGFAVRSSPTGGKPMGFFTKDIKTLDDLFVHTLRDIYYAEQQIAKNLPDMIEKATDQTLKNGFETHLAETKGQIVRIEKVFQMHGVEVKGIDCPAIDGILDEASEIAGEVDDKQVLDAALIAAAQAVEHYEITRYDTLIAWAKKLGRDDCAAVLQQNLEEEKAADQKLNAMALGSINQKAA
jgi:ferritin-like metal-binding protein YciE